MNLLKILADARDTLYRESCRKEIIEVAHFRLSGNFLPSVTADSLAVDSLLELRGQTRKYRLSVSTEEWGAEPLGSMGPIGYTQNRYYQSNAEIYEHKLNEALFTAEAKVNPIVQRELDAWLAAGHKFQQIITTSCPTCGGCGWVGHGESCTCENGTRSKIVYEDFHTQTPMRTTIEMAERELSSKARRPMKSYRVHLIRSHGYFGCLKLYQY